MTYHLRIIDPIRFFSILKSFYAKKRLSGKKVGTIRSPHECRILPYFHMTKAAILLFSKQEVESLSRYLQLGGGSSVISANSL